MKTGVEKEGRLFGGEALLVPERDLEELWSWGFQKYGSNGIQTNRVLINKNHIRIFQQNKVQLGLSVALDGDPGNSTSTLPLRL
jgi:uncharacterized protein